MIKSRTGMLIRRRQNTLKATGELRGSSRSEAMLLSTLEPNSTTSFCLSDCEHICFFCELEKVMGLPPRVGRRITCVFQGLKTSPSMGSVSTGYWDQLWCLSSWLWLLTMNPSFVERNVKACLEEHETIVEMEIWSPDPARIQTWEQKKSRHPPHLHLGVWSSHTTDDRERLPCRHPSGLTCSKQQWWDKQHLRPRTFH